MKKFSKFHKLKNNQWLKVSFFYNKKQNIWFQTIVVAKTKRKCNDCIRKTEYSPKVFYGQVTGNNTGIEALRIALKELLEFENKIKHTQINIVGASDRLNKIYKYLKRYGYQDYEYEKFGKKCTLVYKKIE